MGVIGDYKQKDYFWNLAQGNFTFDEKQVIPKWMEEDQGVQRGLDMRNRFMQSIADFDGKLCHIIVTHGCYVDHCAKIFDYESKFDPVVSQTSDHEKMFEKYLPHLKNKLSPCVYSLKQDDYCLINAFEIERD